LIVTAALAAAFAYGAWPMLSEPGARDVGASPDEFSTGRATAHVEQIAAQPHPVRSAAMADVADYLAAEFEGLGVEVDRHDVRYLHNVVARIQGTDSTGAVLFVSHADSVPQGPGAGDNATGAAAMIEMTRALTAGEPLRNDVIVLLEDGEERGFLGGQAFADSHPWMADVKIAVGLDTAAWGPPHVIQISGDDGLLVRAYADGVGTPLAYGFIATEDPYAEYETFPFRSRGIPAIEIEDTYANVDQHSARDTVDQVDSGRVQQLGDQALGLARTLGNTDLTDARAPDRVFHTLPGLGVVHYPVAWDAVLVALVLVGFAAVVAVGVRRGRLRGRRILAGAGAALGLAVASTLLAVIATLIYDAWRPNPNAQLDEYLLPSSGPYEIVAATVIAAAFGFGFWWLARRIGGAELALGFLGVCCSITALLLVALPGTEYVWAWPSLAAVAVWLWLLRRPQVPRLALLVPAVIAVVLVAPLILNSYFPAGVVNLPLPTFLDALAAGAFIAPALYANLGDPRR
jgi:hypothetical protein